MSALKRLFTIRPEDRPVLAAVAPVFGLVTAANVMTTAFAKALTIASNPFSALPWMFIAAALTTALASLAWIALIHRVPAHRRLDGIVALSAGSFVAIGVLTGLAPGRFSLAIYAWTAAVGSLVIIQSWSWSSTLMPTRQARRLFPMLSAVATLGAAAGGALTNAVLAVGSLSLLLYASAALLALAVLRVHSSRVPPLVDAAPPSRAQTRPHDSPSRLGRIGDALAVLRRTPLLRVLAALAFFAQAASVVMDFQLSSAMKHAYEADAMAGFLGYYYLAANLATVFVALLGAGPLHRLGGVGLAASVGSLVLVVGSATTLLLSTFIPAAIFWAIVATSLSERVADFGVGRQAFQAATMPIPQQDADPARFLLFGVINRLAVIGVGVPLLFAGDALSDYVSLAPLLLIVAGIAVIVSLRVGPAYTRALLDALGARHLAREPAVPSWAGDAALSAVRTLLRSGDPDAVQHGLTMVRDFDVPVRADELTPMLASPDVATVVSALDTLARTDLLPVRHALAPLLHADRPTPVLCAALRVLPREFSEFLPTVEGLTDHPDPAVQSRAFMWLRGGAPDPQTRERLRTRIRVRSGLADINDPEPQAHSDALDAGALPDAPESAQLPGRYLDLVDELPRFLSSDEPELRRLALDIFVQLSIPEHVPLLLDALESPNTRTVALTALGRLPPKLVLASLQERLNAAAPNHPSRRIRLLQLAQRLETPAAAALVASFVSDPLPPLRAQAARALWHLVSRPGAPPIDGAPIAAAVIEHVDDLIRYALVDSHLKSTAPPHVVPLRSEVALRRAFTETVVFQLLGVLYGAAVEQARLKHRDPDPRARSNALELLDATITAPELRVVITYFEASEHTHGRSYTASQSLMAIPTFRSALERIHDSDRDVDAGTVLLEPRDGLLCELYAHALRESRVDADPKPRRRTLDETTHDEMMNRVLLLRDVPLFDAIAADQLLPLAQVARRRAVEADTVIFEEGQQGFELFLILEGRVAIEHDGRTVAELGRRECFGEMAILDDGPRSAAARAIEDTELLLIHRDDFDNMLDIAPGLSRGVIRVLTRRMRGVLGGQA
ncbi:MAG: cyclic nucleotide-binding domain-containing protein [Myxococcota bacterium]